MRLVQCEDTKGQVVSCVQCNRPVSLRFAQADLDGEPFKTYYCPGCVQELLECFPRIDIRYDDGEPAFQHQVLRDATIQRRTYVCTDSDCDIKIPGHSHYRERTK